MQHLQKQPPKNTTQQRETCTTKKTTLASAFKALRVPCAFLAVKIKMSNNYIFYFVLVKTRRENFIIVLFFFQEYHVLDIDLF